MEKGAAAPKEEGMGLLKIAHVPPAAVEIGATVLEAVQVMAEEGVGAVAVVEDGQLRGIFTERDVMLRVVLRERRPNETRVGEVMTAPAHTTSRNTPAEEALSYMLERHIRHLPIVDESGKLQGTLSIRNLLEHMVEDLQRELHSLDQYLLNDGPGG
jgi:CBS domain-containing protein